MASLFDLTGRALDLKRALDAVAEAQAGTEEAAEAEAVLAEMLGEACDDIAEKSDAYVLLMTEWLGEADTADAVAKQMAEKARLRRGAVDQLKARLQSTMEALGTDQIAGAMFRVTLQTNPASCAVTDEAAALKAGYAQEVTTIKPDRRAMLAAWKKDPQSVVAFATVTQGKSLRWRA